MQDEKALASDRLAGLREKIDSALFQQEMPLTGGVITMMFTDIVDSAKVKAEIGDRPYFDDVLRNFWVDPPEDPAGDPVALGKVEEGVPGLRPAS